MATFVKGEIVVLPFPYSNLSATKRRPALVVAALAGADVILCPITSQAANSADALLLSHADFAQGSLQRASYVRADHLLTADESLILYRIGAIIPPKMAEITAAIIRVLSR